MNKASGGDGIPVELFQILKDDAVEVLYSICQLTWRILSIILLVFEMRATVRKLTFSSLVAAAEFSKFPGILSEAL